MVACLLTLDVILEILVWLPAKSALRFKSVCKEWYNFINTPLFARLQLNKSLKPDSRHNRMLVCDGKLSISIVDDVYDPLKWIKLNWPKDTVTNDDVIRSVVGSCNGLVCLEIRQRDNVVFLPGLIVRCFLICNPTTRSFKLILPCPETKWTNRYISYGLGYDIEHDDYKIVATSYILTENDRHVCIYSLKADLWSWSHPPTSFSTGSHYWTIKSEAILVNNMLHYLVKHVTLGLIDDYKIARFDVVSEKWRDDLSLPVQINGYVELGKMDEWLYLHVGEYDHVSDSSDIWLMEEYGSWKKMYHLPKVVYKLSPIALSKDGSHRLFLNDNYDCGPELVWYDQRDNTRETFKLKKLPNDGLWFWVCIASVVAIPGCSLTKLQQVEDRD